MFAYPRRLALFVLLLATACVGKNESRVDSIPRDSLSIVAPAAASVSTPWDAARLRGADFRAVGQEPGWTLEIHDGQMLRYIGDYGRDTVVAAMSQSLTHTSGDHTYSMRVGQRQVDATIREAACADAMSGETFTHAVTVRVDAQELSGCGRLLGN